LRLLDGGHLEQVDPGQRAAEHEEVEMAVVEAGDDPPPFGIKHFRAGATQRQDLVVLADGDDAAGLDGEGRGHRARRVEGGDAATAEDQVGRGGVGHDAAPGAGRKPAPSAAWFAGGGS
jgi:hypothetical protein